MAGTSDELTTRFTEALFAKFPEWRGYGRPVAEDSGNVAIEVQVPQVGTDRHLYILTTDGEITIGFDRWHTHVGTYVGIDLGESVEEALRVVEDFVNEQTVVTIVERDGRWFRSSLEDRHDLGQDLPEGKIRRLSWKGTLDEEFDHTAAT